MGKIVTYTLRILPENENEQPTIHLFQKFIADNEATVYTVDHIVTDKNTGNQLFKEFTTGKQAEKQITETEMSNEEICDYLLNSMDPIANAMDDAQQLEEAKTYNNHIANILAAFNQIAE
jgi:ABC-type thiamine transport system substrate-binding protein